MTITLRAARINAGLDQREAAEKLGINVSTLRNYETGKTVPNWNTVDKIRELYRVPLDFLRFGE